MNARGVDAKAWYGAIDALSLQLPIESPAKYPGKPGSLADICRRRFIADEIEYRERLHPQPDEDELAYRGRLTTELDGKA